MSEIQNISELNFNSIKTNIKEYLKSQDEFSDFNFEGSGLSVLLDILTYNTQYTSYYANMIANEMFLDSAVLRSSIVSNAKLLGYLPRSSTSAKANISLQFNNVPSGNTSDIIVPSGTKFTASVDGQSLIFFTTESYSTNASNNYTIENIEIVEGRKFSFEYVVDNTLRNSYVIPNDNVDINQLKVLVQESVSNLNIETYNRVLDSSDLNPTALVYFIEENTNGNYEISFGKGIYGNEPANGNIITLEYVISKGSIANNVSKFSLSEPISGYSDITITTNQPSYAGSERETKDSIQSLAPISYQTQNRAITSQDYRNLLLREYPNIIDVKVWGGEENNPPQFGKVFISLLPKENFVITDSIKGFILDNILKPYNITSIFPEIINEEYIDIIIDSTIYYDKSKTLLRGDEIRSLVKEKIKEFTGKSLGRFDTILHYSNLTSNIDDSSESIISNENDLKIYISKETFPTVNYKYIFQFNNSIQKSSITSNEITLSDNIKYSIDDDGLGNIRLYRTVNNSKIYNTSFIGIVNYTKGEIEITSLNILTDILRIYSIPVSKNLVAKRNQILRITDNNISVSLTETA